MCHRQLQRPPVALAAVTSDAFAVVTYDVARVFQTSCQHRCTPSYAYACLNVSPARDLKQETDNSQVSEAAI